MTASLEPIVDTRPPSPAAALEQVGDDVDAAPLDLRGRRVLVLVDHVLVERVGHQRFRLRLHPGRDERREVQPRTAVEQQFVVHNPVRRVGGGAVAGMRFFGNGSTPGDRRTRPTTEPHRLPGRCD